MRKVFAALLMFIASSGLVFAQEPVPEEFVVEMGSLLMDADAGIAAAQYDLGFYYSTGIGVGHDDVEAAKWFRMAADQNHAEAEMKLGTMYAAGKGVAQNDIEAGKWLLRAAEHGNVEAQVKLGIRNEQGYGVAPDFMQAYMWYTIAGQNGDTDAVEWRDTLSGTMTPAQIAEAQKRAREWMVAHPEKAQ